MCTLPSHLRSLLLATPPCSGWVTSLGTRSQPCQAPRAGSHKQHSEPRRGERVSTESTGRVTSRASVSVNRLSGAAPQQSSPTRHPPGPGDGHTAHTCLRYKQWQRASGQHLLCKARPVVACIVSGRPIPPPPPGGALCPDPELDFSVGAGTVHGQADRARGSHRELPGSSNLSRGNLLL